MPHTDRQPPARARQPLVEPASPPLDRDATDALLVAAGHGDVDAFAAFYDHTAATVFGLMRAGLDEQATAEQATQRVYLQLWRTAPRFDLRGGSAYSVLLFLARRDLIARVQDLLTSTVAAIRTGHSAVLAGQ